MTAVAPLPFGVRAAAVLLGGAAALWLFAGLVLWVFSGGAAIAGLSAWPP